MRGGAHRLHLSLFSIQTCTFRSHYTAPDNTRFAKNPFIELKRFR